MLGVIYLLLCFGVGWGICSFCFPDLYKLTRSSYDNRAIKLSPYFLLLPVWFIVGVLNMTWSVYLIALAFSSRTSPLIMANAIVMPIGLLFFIFSYYKLIVRGKASSFSLICQDSETAIKEGLILILVSLLASILMWSTFYISDGQLNIAVSVFSDFSPHIGMIRSFSYGNNFPSSYSHYAGEDIRYHFMFMFLAGNMEFLGLPIDYAFNIPSILSFVSAFMLLYVLTLKITGKVLSSVLALLFFAFRSGKAIFVYLSEIPKGNDVFKTLSENTNFIGKTPHEDWGLWNLNVYCNQRHLAFGLAAMFFLIIMFLPHLYETFEMLKTQVIINKNSKTSIAKKGNYKMNNDRTSNIWVNLRRIFFTKDGWRVKSIGRPLALGILLGSLSFFHGSAVIGCLLVLFVIAVLAYRRLEFLITAIITLVLSILQTWLFIEGSAVTPQYLFGFIADNKTIFGVASYLEQLLGVLIPIVIIAFIFGKPIERYLILAFIAPLIFAFTLMLTVDVTVNHKYIMMSCILLGVFAASLISWLLDKGFLMLRITAAILILMMTLTGIYDFTTVLRKNSKEGKIILYMEDPLTEYINEHSDSKDIFLTAPYTINQVVFGGAMLYQGHQYYAWSAGYDTFYRDAMVGKMYEAASPEELDKLIEENDISFIVIDYDNRNSMYYNLNEDNIRATYECVYTSGSGEWNISLFDTRNKIY